MLGRVQSRERGKRGPREEKRKLFPPSLRKKRSVRRTVDTGLLIHGPYESGMEEGGKSSKTIPGAKKEKGENCVLARNPMGSVMKRGGRW